VARAWTLDGLGGSMPFIGKSALPCDPHPAAEHQVFDEAVRGGHTLFTAPSGYLLAEGLSAALQRRGRRVIWVRLGPEDRDPGMLLLSLITAARRWQPDFGRRTVQLMREQPGPIAGWPLVFARLAEELHDLLATSGALVLQDVHHLHRKRLTLELLGSHLLPALTSRVVCVLTSGHDLPSAALPSWIVRRSARDVRLADATVSRVLNRAAPDLSGERLRQVARLCQGQAALLAAVCAAWVALGPVPVERAVTLSVDPQELLTLLACAWLTMVDVNARRALALALRLGYSHPALMSAAVGADWLPLGPWLQKLSDGWQRVRTVWKAPLRSALGAKRLLDHDAIHRAADYLLEVGAVEQAVPLYLELKDTDRVAQAIADEADRLMDLGQWETMGEWLGRLPDRTLKARPWLVFHQAEIAASQDRMRTAEYCLSSATSLFIARHEPEGACQSMLAESALAAGHMELTRAQARALAASAMADAAGLPWYQAWAAWQLGSIALVSEKPDDAAVSFGRAAEVAARVGDQAMLDLTQEAERLIGQLQEIRRRRKELHTAYLDLEAAEHAAVERLLAHVGTAHERAATLVMVHGWSHTPFALKLPTLPLEPQDLPTPQGREWWLRVRQLFTARRHAAPIATETADGKPPPTALAPSPAQDSLGHANVPLGWPSSVDPATGAHLSHQRELVRTTSAWPNSGQAPLLTAHLLGPLRLALNDVPVNDWPSGRSRALFGYLLTHRDPWSPSEVLMEVFWPDATPEAARNNLHVAVHRLRRALRTAGDVPVVIIDDGVYRLHPGLQLWVDVDEFDHHVRGGRQFEAAGDLAGALSEYELATALYQGDFLAGDRYEEWPILARERLRLAWLDTVERLSRLYFSQGRYASCATLCQRTVECDPCREDAHRRLMRSYSRQGQLQLAVRQYRICVEALRTELGVKPSPETIDLHGRIRRREPV
jgi:DNA-binding SARP family transcriptional activator